MKLLTKLGSKQADLLNEILRDQYTFYPKKVSKFQIKNISTSGDIQNALFCEGKIDVEYFGTLMYILGMKIKY